MSRRKAPTAARREARPVEVVAPRLVEIPEDAFHRARSAATAHTNTAAGETFATPGAVYVRVNERHFRISGAAPLTHAEALALVGHAPCWRRGDGR